MGRGVSFGVLPDGPTARGAATSWRVYLVWGRAYLALPLVGIRMVRGRSRPLFSRLLVLIRRKMIARWAKGLVQGGSGYGTG